MPIEEIKLYRVRLPLKVPYQLSYHTFTSFEPIIARVRDGDGQEGWGEQHISPGSSAETRDGGWAFVNEFAETLIGRPASDAIDMVSAVADRSKVAATALVTALEMICVPDRLTTSQDTRLPLLTPFNAKERGEIQEEVEQRLQAGFRTFKIKVGKDVATDLVRVGEIQNATSGRAALRIDANRAFSRDDAIAFATRIDPDHIELFEQPCDAEDWVANAAVAAVSKVPVMLDEPICAIADIERAARVPGVKLCKVKLKRFVSMKRLDEAIDRIKALGMNAVLGDGLGSEINCWMEGSVALRKIDNAGEYNGYVKVRPEVRLLENPLPFENGHLILPAAYWPRINEARLKSQALEARRYANTKVGAAGR